MLRFSIGMTCLLFTLVAVTSLVVPADRFLGTEDLLDLGWPSERLAKEQLERYGYLCIDLNAALRGEFAPGDIWVSVRPWTEPQDYQSRRAWDLAVACFQESDRRVVQDENLPGDRGYSVRFQGRGKVHFEIVRYRDHEMLIVRVSQAKIPGGREERALSGSEEAARAIEARMRAKLRSGKPQSW